MDPTGLLTILGLVVASFAIIPKERRLDLSLRITRIDWLIISISFILVHYIMYFPTFKAFGFYIELGEWKWGFDEENTTYLIFLFLSFYLFWRIKTSKVSKANINGFSELFERLLSENKHMELTFLLENHLDDILRVQKQSSLRNYVASKIRPEPEIFGFLNSDRKENVFKNAFREPLTKLSNNLEHQDSHNEIAFSITQRIFTSQKYVSYISQSRPYFCLNTIKKDFSQKKDFLALFFQSQIRNNHSIYYYELENSHNLRTGNRFELYESNKLLYFLFNEVSTAEKLSIYKPVGDEVFHHIDNNKELIERYQEPFGTYEKDKNKCPIYVSLHFFDIMITESMHQGVRWHMWLFYFSTFTKKIINKIPSDKNSLFQAEFPTPLHFLLHEIVSTVCGWLREFEDVENKEDIMFENEHLSHDNGSIIKSASLALGDIIYMILTANRINNKFKVEILETVMTFIRDYKSRDGYESIINITMHSILKRGFFNKIDSNYISKFNGLYQEMDHMLIYDLEEFNSILKSVSNNRGET